MKKIFILLFVLLFAVTLTSCNSDKTVEKTKTETKEETKELVPVDSVTVKDELGNDVVITKETPFYDVLNYFDTNYQNNKMIEFNSEITFGDRETANTTLVAYYVNENETLFDYKLKDGNKTYSAQEYSKEVRDDVLNWSRNFFAKYQYGLEKAFGGQEITCENGNSTNTMYSNYNYPMMVPGGSDFGNAESQAKLLTQMMNNFCFFAKFDDFEFNGEKIILEDYVTRSFELYEDSVIFIQSAPYIVKIFVGPDMTKYAFYAGCIADNCEITQTIKFDLKTQQIEYVEVKGNTRSSVIQPNILFEVNVTAKLSTLDKYKYDSAVEELVNYVKKNSNT